MSVGPRGAALGRRALAWLLVLGPLFVLTYGATNWITAQREDVGAVVFAWESRVPLWLWTIVPYWSIDVLYALSLFICTSRSELDTLGRRLLSVQLLCVSCFLLFPLRFTFERPALNGVFGWMFDVLMGFDRPFNQAPSLHIALLVVLWVAYARHVRGSWRWLLHSWFALIGVSVLTTWQHHFIDVPTGALAGWLCVWLWPEQGHNPLSAVRLRQARQWRIALRYGVGSVLLAMPALSLGGAWLWLSWPALALLMMALNYVLFGTAGFQKGTSGRLSPASRCILAPYLIAAWINSRLWTRGHPQPDEVCDGVWLGRLPSARALRASHFAAVVDLCAERSCVPGKQAYHSLPVLDLTVPDIDTCRAAAVAIERGRHRGAVLVCCALGYSRSAAAVAAWLLCSGRAANVDAAVACIRAARPHVVLHPAHRQVLEHMLKSRAPAVSAISWPA